MAASILVQGSDAPVLRDDWPDGGDIVCRHCNDSILAAGVADDQIWDVTFVCFRCGGTTDSPVLPAGMAMPPNSVVLGPDRYLIVQGVVLRRGTIVGEGAVRRRHVEAGARGDTFGSKNHNRTLSSETIDFDLTVLRGLLGESYDRLLASDDLGMRSPTPPKHRHPLALLIRGVESAKLSLNGNVIIATDALCVSELSAILHVFRRWELHPFWPKIVKALVNEYSHTAITLSAASWLEDVGNSVVLHDTHGTRTPDILLVTAPRQRMSLEVKAPRVLRWPTRGFGDGQAVEVVATAMKNAAGGAKRQLSSSRPGLLAIGGFGLPKSEVDRLQQAATSYFESKRREARHRQVAALIVLSLGVHLEASPILMSNGERMLSTYLRVAIAKNPGYGGDIPFRTDVTPPTTAVQVRPRDVP